MLGSIISAGASLLGGAIGRNSQKNANENNAALQKEFAQNSIRWKVADAEAAGIHPLAALGASGYSASPSYVGDTSLPTAFSQMGQDISTSINRTRTQPERINAKMEALSLERGELENELLRSQIAREKAALNPPLPSGSGVGDVIPQAARPVVGDIDAPYKEPGQITDYGFARTPTGLVVVPSNDMKQRIEDNFWAESAWMLRNGLVPLFSGGLPAPDAKRYPPPSGFSRWKWDAWHGEFRPAN